MSPLRRVAVIIALACGALAHAAARQQPPAFRGGADVVEVDASVVDASGHVVTDLSADDFIVSENGRPQQIQAFYLVQGSQVSATAASIGGAQDSATTAGPGLTPDRFRRVYVVVFDSLHLSNDGYRRTKAAARALFEKHFEAADIGCVVSNGQIVNGRMTSDRAELLKAVDSVQPAALAIPGFDLLLDYSRWADDTVAASRDVAAMDEARRTALTVGTLSELMENLKTVVGRKTVLLMSNGFGTPAWVERSDFGLARLMVGGAQGANARVYAVDARGLVGGISNTLMDGLAADTGGYVIRNENSLDDAIAKIAAETSTYYVLGYVRAGTADGKLRSIDVKVKRAGLTVRARRGYVPTP